MTREERIEEKFLKSFVVGEHDKCWEWQRTVLTNGYGLLRFGSPNHRTQFLAHRYSYKYFVGEIPVGMVIDHLCENRKCINPSHLDPTTIWDNVQRTYARGKPKPFALRPLLEKGHCTHGHLIVSKDDLYRNGCGGKGEWKMVCKMCAKLKKSSGAQKKWKRENKEKSREYFTKWYENGGREYLAKKRRVDK